MATQDVNFNFKERTFLVSGASSGLGLVVAEKLLDQGASLLLIGRRKKAELPEDFLSRFADNFIYHSIDFSDNNTESLLKDAMDCCVATFGKISGMLHATGCYHFSPVSKITDVDIEKLMKVNIASIYALMKMFAKKKYRHQSSSVVLTSSTSGLVGESCTSLYALTKSAVLSLTRSFAAEFINKNIRFNCVVPAIIDGGMSNKLFDVLTENQISALREAHPGGFGSFAEVSYVVEFLLSNASSWINGQSIVCDGGYTALK